MSVYQIACYSQPLATLPKWKSRGFTACIHSELQNGTVKQADWRKAARDAGLVYIDTYLADDDVNDASLIGWVIKNSDEWNRARGNPPVRPPVQPFVDEAARLAALNTSAHTNKLIFANADGPGVTTALWEKPPYNGVVNNEKALLPSLTARSMDWYPVVASVTPNDPRRPMYLPAQGVKRIKTWCDEWHSQPAKHIAIVEAAKNSNAPVGVTGAQMKEQVDYLIGNLAFPWPSASGAATTAQEYLIDILCWWTANGKDGPGWNWDAMNDDQLAAMLEINAKLIPSVPPQPTLEQRIVKLEAQMKAIHGATE